MGKSVRLNVYNTIRNFDTRQTGASQKGICPDAGEFTVFLEGDARQATTVTEGHSADACHAVWDHETRQITAATEGLLPYTSDTIRDRDAC